MKPAPFLARREAGHGLDKKRRHKTRHRRSFCAICLKIALISPLYL
jgi:hypothetical protein